jgi:hypothetical protein
LVFTTNDYYGQIDQEYTTLFGAQWLGAGKGWDISGYISEREVGTVIITLRAVPVIIN